MGSTRMVAVLFTDLVGSTALFARVGPEAAEELRRGHFAVLRGAIIANGGTEVKTVGDGLMVVFASIADAVNCAVEMQQRVEARNRASDTGLAVRIGVSLGDAELDDLDYFGRPVVEAARLCAAAGSGEILITESLRALVGARGGHVFTSVGDVELKGLDPPVSAWAVEWVPLAESRVPLPPRLSVDFGGGFYGRTSEWRLLDTALKSASEGPREVVLVSGEPGIGKTRLAVEFGRVAHDQGGIVLYGRCDEDLGVAYQPIAEALRHLVAHIGDDVLVEHVARDGGELVRLVPELRERLADWPAPQRTDPETERYLLFGAVAGLLHAASAQRPLVLILDDLHWADKPSLLLLRHLVASDDLGRVLVVGIYREADLPRAHPLNDLLAALHRERDVQHVTLRGLDDVELIEWMETTAGHELDAPGVHLAHALSRETDGNPFFAGELLRHLAEIGAIVQRADGRWTMVADLADLGLPKSVRDVIGRRVARLGDDAFNTLSVAAVIGRDFDAELLAQTLGRDEDSIIAVLDDATRAVVVEEVPQALGRYSFVHALIAHTLYEDLSATRRQRLHQRVAEALEDLCGDEPGDRLGALASHWAQALRPADAAKAIDYARRAGDRALAQLAPDEAIRWYGQAIELLAQQPDRDERLRCELQLSLGDAQRQSGDGRYRETLLDAAHLASQLDDADRLVRAVLANNRGINSVTGHVDMERVALLEAAVEAVGPTESAQRARVLALLATELTYAGDFERRFALAEEAIAVARRLNDLATLAWVLTATYLAMWVPATFDLRLAHTTEALALAEQLNDPVLVLLAALTRHLSAMQHGDRDETERCMALQRELVTRHVQPSQRWLCTMTWGATACWDGDLEQAERHAAEALQLGEQTGQPDVLVWYAALLLTIRLHQGRIGELEDLIVQAVADNPGLPAFRAVLAELYCETNRPDQARHVIDADVADDFAAFPLDGVWLASMLICGSVIAHLGDRDAAARLFERLVPWADQVDYQGPSGVGPVALVLGRLASALGHYDEAETYFTQARALSQRLRSPLFLADTGYWLAEMLVSRGRAGDRERAVPMLEHALATARQHGFGRIERRAAALLVEADQYQRARGGR